ncbi:DMT family transporter [Sinobaca sp. H24]|uniref:DMT family transporter n=1 Tax=Sinobaca sp. H24 TaxID=2923376 RepID=UPI00207A5437|nr:DMT family transporter [Sinobaca sp. H24]
MLTAAIFIPLMAGIGLSLQSAVNGTLGSKIGTIESAFLTFFTGAVILTIVIPFFGGGTILDVFQVPAWQLICAVFGFLYLSLMVFSVPRIGVTVAVVNVIVGQLAASMAVDHFGWFHTPVEPFDLQRFFGVLLLLGALYFLFKKDKKQSAAEAV